MKNTFTVLLIATLAIAASITAQEAPQAILEAPQAKLEAPQAKLEAPTLAVPTVATVVAGNFWRKHHPNKKCIKAKCDSACASGRIGCEKECTAIEAPCEDACKTSATAIFAICEGQCEMDCLSLCPTPGSLDCKMTCKAVCTNNNVANCDTICSGTIIGQTDCTNLCQDIPGCKAGSDFANTVCDAACKTGTVADFNVCNAQCDVSKTGPALDTCSAACSDVTVCEDQCGLSCFYTCINGAVLTEASAKSNAKALAECDNACRSGEDLCKGQCKSGEAWCKSKW